MAVTLNTSPTGQPSAQDGLWHVATSDASGSPDMRYVFQVFVNGVEKLLVKKYPEPDNGKAYFDASPTVRNEFSYEWFEPLSSAYVAQPDTSGEIALTYNIRVGEDVSGITTLNMASGNVTVYNYCPPLFARRVATIADKINNWLTNRPLIINAGLGENIYIPFYTNQGTVELEAQSYGYNNALIESETDNTSVTTVSGFHQLNIGSAAISTRLGMSIDASVKYYRVNIKGFGSVQVNLVCNPKYTPILLHFVNQYGMWETLRFDLTSRLNMEVERKAYSTRDYRFNGNQVDYARDNRYYEGRVNYLNKQDYTFRVTADALSDEEYTWAAELVYSPQILMEYSGYFYPVTVKNSTYEFSKYVNNKLRAFELDIELNQTRYSHLR